jgi:hypothetical protein
LSHALCLQPWVNVTGTGITVLQNDSEWADLVGYAAAAIYVELGFITPQGASQTQLNFDTSPSKDPALFQPYAGITLAGTPAAGVQPILLPTGWGTVNIPMARFLRWSIVFGTVATNIQFRVWLSLMQAGW